MSPCPKCGFDLSEDALECPSCGVIPSKYRPPGLEPTATAPTEDPESTAAGPAHAIPPAPSDLHGASYGEVYTTDHRITAETVDALRRARPWIGFLAIYGFVVVILMILASIGLLFTDLPAAELLPLVVVYLLYSVVGFAVVLPLRRSAVALRDLPRLGTVGAVEAFAIHQSSFWRRVGIFTAIGLVLAILLILLVLLLAVFA